MKLKSNNVNISKLDENIKNKLKLIEETIRRYEGKNYIMTITSGNDGKHMRDSLHYTDKAIDIRTIDMKYSHINVINLRKALGKDYDVIREYNHIHLEYDPKK